MSRVAAQVTEDYWSLRPRGSQLGAWASHQSQPIASRAALLYKLAQVTARFADVERIPVPSNWGGYLIAAEVVEFWRAGRTGCTIGFGSAAHRSNVCNPEIGKPFALIAAGDYRAGCIMHSISARCINQNRILIYVALSA